MNGISKISILLLIFFTACGTHPDAQNIIKRAIETHGGERFESSKITFNFRGTVYTVERRDGRYTFTRTFSDSLGTITGILSNEGFSRTINGETIELSEEQQENYLNSINSVVYFALLPYKLNDAAVNLEYLGEAKIKGEPYYEIKVTFDRQGGGESHNDTFVYWIHQNNYTMDYLAYRFHTGGGGTRFREAYNIRTINGIRFADYHNYGSDEMETPLRTYDTLFEKGKLPKVSDVNISDIKVELFGLEGKGEM